MKAGQFSLAPFVALGSGSVDDLAYPLTIQGGRRCDREFCTLL